MAVTLRRAVLQMVRKPNVVISTLRQKTTANTENNILKSVYDDVPITKETLCDFIWQNLDRWPDKTATVCAITGRGYTFAQTHKMAMAFGASLKLKLKLKEDDKVVIVLPNVPEYTSVVFGALQAGCVVSPMNPIYSSDELKRQFELVDCKAVVTSNMSYSNVSEALEMMTAKIPVIVIDNDDVPDGAIKFSEFAQDWSIETSCLKSVRRSADDVAVIPFSSGTSGFPKGVELSHKSVLAANRMISLPDIQATLETTATQQSVFAAVVPFFHIFGFNGLLLNQFYNGCKLVTMPYYTPELYLNTIVNYKTDALVLVPPLVLFLGRHPSVTAEHLKPVRAVMSGAAPLSAGDAEAFLSKNRNISFRQGYGLTETNSCISVPKNMDTNYGAVGHVFPNCQVRITDVNTQEALGPGEEGEIWFKGPLVMKGYHKNDEATKKDFTEDGWYKTGDVGRYDESKYLYITERLKELIKVKGFQVAPAELETVIRMHPKVADCAVLGVPDPISGETPKAFLAPFPGKELEIKEVLEFVNSKLSPYKRIKQAQVVDEIPRTPAGKILKRVLKKEYC